MEVSEEKLKPGVAIGMAYQGSGNGSILYIEAASYAGKGGLRLTGSLGDVIKESAELAMSWIKANAHLMNLNLSKLDSLDLHIHFPSGSIKKDGPSAGVGLVLALVSLFSGLPIDNTLAVTGEISLRGQILPVGGIREKVGTLLLLFLSFFFFFFFFWWVLFCQIDTGSHMLWVNVV
jgi:ATP-dependent Lon protease